MHKIIYIILFFIANCLLPIFSVAQGTWTQKANIGTSTMPGHNSFSIGTKGYIGDISKKLWEWNQSTNAWTQKVSFPSYMLYAGSFSIGNKGYWIVTDTSSFPIGNSLWEWDQSTNTWAQKSIFPGVGRLEFMCFSIGTKGYFGTGGDGGTTFYKDFWEWDEPTNAWTQKANFGGSARFEAAGFVIGNNIYIGTGVGSGGQNKDFWEWDQTTNTWVQKSNFLGSQRENATGFSIGCNGYIGLGCGPDGPPHYKDFYKYEPCSDTWIQIANFGGAGREYAAAFSIGNKGYVTSGAVWWDSPKIYYDDLWEYSDSNSIGISVSQNNVSCNGGNNGSATATISGGCAPYTYLWSNGQTASSATGLSVGIYTVNVNDACNNSTQTVSITQPSALSSNISTTPPDCNAGAGTATITSSGGTPSYTYSWSPSGGTSSSATGLSAGNYTVAITDSKGCTQTSTVSITQPAPLSSNISTTPPNCNGGTGSATITSSGGTPSYTYSWSPSGGTSSSATGLSAGNYTVAITDLMGCTKTSTVNIIQPTAISTTISSTQTTCNGNTGSASINAAGGTGGYTYLWNPSAQTTQTATGLSAANYSVTITDMNGCITSNTITITSVGITASAGPNSTICSGQNVVLTASGGANYLWSNGSSTATINISPTVTTTYSVIVSSGSCSDTAAATVTVSPGITATAGPNGTICSGANITLAANGGNNYSWSNGATTTAINVSPTATTTYSVIVSSGLCSDTAFTTVTVLSGITASSSPNTTICTGQSATITASGGTNYSWSTGNTTASINISPTVTTTYSVIVSSGSCFDTASVTVVVSLPPSASANGTTVCAGQTAMLSASGGGTYSWSTGQTTSSITATATATVTYSVIVSIGTCTDTVTASVVVNPNPVASVSGDVTITAGTSVTLTASGGGTYSWNNGSNNSSLTVSPPVTTVYCVYVSNIYNCTDTACVTVAVTAEPIDCSLSATGELFIPNAFSPNGDGENESVKLLYGNYACIDTYKFIVYNRWGENVFETENPLDEWDGSYKGKIEGTAVFAYYMKTKLINGDEIIKKGNISLIK